MSRPTVVENTEKAQMKWFAIPLLALVLTTWTSSAHAVDYYYFCKCQRINAKPACGPIDKGDLYASQRDISACKKKTRQMVGAKACSLRSSGSFDGVNIMRINECEGGSEMSSNN